MSPRRYFSDMMRSPNFRNETYKKNGGSLEYKAILFYQKIKNKIQKVFKK